MKSSAVVDAYIERYWRFLVEAQRADGIEFVMGKREGSYFWNLEGDRRILDCGNSGGVHSLGHRNPEIIGALRSALDYLDAGIWSMPTPEHLELQDALAKSAPTKSLNRSVATLGATESIDLAIMFSFRVTGRRQVVSYRHGYHGHSGFAALATGSVTDGLSQHYSLPTSYSSFFPQYGTIESAKDCIDETTAAVVLEPMNYETFEPAPARYLGDLAQLCRDRGALFIIDETRTGLGRSGKLWMTSHYDCEPDAIVLGKGLGGGVYPASALLTNEKTFDACMNGTHWGYQSALAGSPIAAVVATKVLEIAQRRELLENVGRIEKAFVDGFHELSETSPDLFGLGWALGGIASLSLKDERFASTIRRELFQLGVMCHSVSAIQPRCVKFFPCLTSDPVVVHDIIEALSECARTRRGMLDAGKRRHV
jgi:putrescine aminotransferase